MKALFAKEFKEHGPPFLLLALLQAGLFLTLFLFSWLQPERGSFLQPFRAFMILGFPLGAFYLGHRLITREFSGKTQFFLEALPVSRAKIFWAKWLTGLLINLLLVSFFLLISFSAMLFSELLSPLFVFLVLARTVTYLFFFHNLAVTISFLGRYRILCLIVLVLSAIMVAAHTDWNLAEQGPLALVYDTRFVFERYLLPLSDIAVTLAAGLVFLLLSLILNLTREGSMAALLAEKMSHREKVFLVGLIFGSIVLLVILDERSTKEPYQMPDAVVAAGQGPFAAVSKNGSIPDAELRFLANWLQEELSGLQSYLDLDRLPPVFLTIRRDLDPDKFELGRLQEAEGFVVRLSYDPARWRPDEFRAWLLPELLAHLTRGRVLLERNRWLLDGFPLFFAGREPRGPSSQQLFLRALHGTAGGVDRRMLDSWLSFREAHGAEVAAGVAWSALRFLEQIAGQEACRKLLRLKLGIPIARDLRATLNERNRPLPKAIQEVTGLSYEAFIQAWQEDLQARRGELSRELAQIPRIRGEIKTVSLSPATLRLEYRLHAETPLPPGQPVRFRYLELPIDDVEIEPTEVTSEEQSFKRLSSWNKLPGTWPRGCRFAWTFSLEAPALGCPIISGWQRVEIR